MSKFSKNNIPTQGSISYYDPEKQQIIKTKLGAGNTPAPVATQKGTKRYQYDPNKGQVVVVDCSSKEPY